MKEEIIYYLTGLIVVLFLFKLIEVLRYLFKSISKILKINKRNYAIYIIPIRTFRVVGLISIFVVIFIIIFEQLDSLRMFFYTIYNAKSAHMWSSEALNYIRIMDRTHQFFLFGVLSGLLLEKITESYNERGAESDKKQYRYMLVGAFGAIIVTIVLAPYLDRIFRTATSFELAQIAKVTFATPQVTSSQSTANAGPGSVSAQEYRPNDVREPLRFLGKLTKETSDEKFPQCNGTIKRDNIYNDRIVKSSPTRPSYESFIRAVENDTKMFNSLRSVPRCLEEYAVKFSDYRLLLIDVKPIINIFTAITRQDKDAINKDYAALLANDLVNELSITISQASQMLARISGGKDKNTYCKKARNQLINLQKSIKSYRKLDKKYEDNNNISTYAQHEINDIVAAFQGNMSPYKTLALSYILSAVGAVDKGASEIHNWLVDSENNSEIPDWFKMRMQIEKSMMMMDFLPNRERNSIFKSFVVDYIKNFSSLVPNKNIVDWSKTCSDKSYYEKALMSSYFTSLNDYVKAFSDIDGISVDVMKVSEDLYNTDISCFGDLDGFSQQTDSWRANILTSYASSLIAASYSEQLYGRAKNRQLDMRDRAKDSLIEAIKLFENDEKKKINTNSPCDEDNEKSDSIRGALVVSATWGERHSTAKNLLLKILPVTE